MINLTNAAAAVVLGLAILGLAVAGAPASPALVQPSQERQASQERMRTPPGHAARAQASLRAQANLGEIGAYGMTQHRANAMRECNERANAYSQPVHGNMQSYAYWSCMMMRGEQD